MATSASVRDLKNQTTDLLRKVEKGTLVVVTRRGKPVATLKPFEERDLQQQQPYPTVLSNSLRKNVLTKYPELGRRTSEQVSRDFERITQKVRRSLPFKSWREMDRVLKGDRYGLTR